MTSRSSARASLARAWTRASSARGVRCGQRGGGRQAKREELLRHRVVQLPRQPGAFLDDRKLAVALVQPRVRHRDRRVRREQREELLVGGGETAGRAAVGEEDDAEGVGPVLDRDAEEVLEDRMRGRPALERRIPAYVRQPLYPVVAEHQGEQPVLPGQWADPLPLLVRDAFHDELGERPLVVGHAEGGVPGVEELRGGPDDHLQDLVHGQVPRDREHRRADGVQCGVPIRFHGSDRTAAGSPLIRSGNPAAVVSRPSSAGRRCR
jgi:hypothetical protein